MFRESLFYSQSSQVYKKLTFKKFIIIIKPSFMVKKSSDFMTFIFQFVSKPSNVENVLSTYEKKNLHLRGPPLVESFHKEDLYFKTFVASSRMLKLCLTMKSPKSLLSSYGFDSKSSMILTQKNEDIDMLSSRLGWGSY